VAVLLGPLGCAPRTTEKAEPSPELAGVRLTLLVVDDDSLVKAISLLRGQWQAETRSELTVTGITAKELTTSVAEKRLAADAVIYAPQHLGTLAESQTIQRLGQDTLQEPELDWPDIFELLKTREVVWGSDVFAVPLGSPALLCFFQEGQLQALGLQPPKSWSEYQQVATALAENQKNSKIDAAAADNSAGTTPDGWQPVIEPLGAGWAGRTLLARAASYARHANHYSTLFNMQTMEPLIASPPFVRALDELSAAARLTSPEVRQFTPVEVWSRIATGRAGLALCWPAHRDHAEEQSSAVELPELSCVEVPGAAEAYNPTTGQWDRRAAGVTSVPLVGAAGRVGSIVSGTAEKKGALRLLAWLSSRQWSDRTLAASDEAAPFRASQIATAQAWTRDLPAGQSQQYVSTLAASLTAADCLVILRIPGADRYLAALDDAVRRAVHGPVTAPVALNGVAEQWRGITAELGLDRQREAYQRSLGL